MDGLDPPCPPPVGGIHRALSASGASPSIFKDFRPHSLSFSQLHLSSFLSDFGINLDAPRFQFLCSLIFISPVILLSSFFSHSLWSSYYSPCRYQWLYLLQNLNFNSNCPTTASIQPTIFFLLVPLGQNSVAHSRTHWHYIDLAVMGFSCCMRDRSS